MESAIEKNFYLPRLLSTVDLRPWKSSEVCFDLVGEPYMILDLPYPVLGPKNNRNVPVSNYFIPPLVIYS